MQTFKLFKDSDLLCNPSIVDFGGDVLGIVKRWDFTNNPNFEGKSYLFKLNSSLQLESLIHLPEFDGLRDYTLFKDGRRIFAFIFHKGEIFLYRIREDGVSYSTRMSTEYIDELKTQYFTNKNFSPIEGKLGTDLCVYSLNPFKLLSMDCVAFHHIHSGLNYKEMPLIPHGGTRFIRFNDEEYLGLFHTYTNCRMREYNVYAITLSSTFPHEPMRVTALPILNGEDIVPPNLQCDPRCCWLNPNSKVVFERGIMKTENNIIISYGVQDKLSFLSWMSCEEMDKLLGPNTSKLYTY